MTAHLCPTPASVAWYASNQKGRMQLWFCVSFSEKDHLHDLANEVRQGYLPEALGYLASEDSLITELRVVPTLKEKNNPQLNSPSLPYNSDQLRTSRTKSVRNEVNDSSFQPNSRSHRTPLAASMSHAKSPSPQTCVAKKRKLTRDPDTPSKAVPTRATRSIDSYSSTAEALAAQICNAIHIGANCLREKQGRKDNEQVLETWNEINPLDDNISLAEKHRNFITKEIHHKYLASLAALLSCFTAYLLSKGRRRLKMCEKKSRPDGHSSRKSLAAILCKTMIMLKQHGKHVYKILAAIVASNSFQFSSKYVRNIRECDLEPCSRILSGLLATDLSIWGTIDDRYIIDIARVTASKDLTYDIMETTPTISHALFYLQLTGGRYDQAIEKLGFCEPVLSLKGVTTLDLCDTGISRGSTFGAAAVHVMPGGRANGQQTARRLSDNGEAHRNSGPPYELATEMLGNETTAPTNVVPLHSICGDMHTICRPSETHDLHSNPLNVGFRPQHMSDLILRRISGDDMQYDEGLETTLMPDILVNPLHLHYSPHSRYH